MPLVIPNAFLIQCPCCSNDTINDDDDRISGGDDRVVVDAAAVVHMPTVLQYDAKKLPTVPSLPPQKPLPAHLAPQSVNVTLPSSSQSRKEGFSHLSHPKNLTPSSSQRSLKLTLSPSFHSLKSSSQYIISSVQKHLTMSPSSQSLKGFTYTNSSYQSINSSPTKHLQSGAIEKTLPSSNKHQESDACTNFGYDSTAETNCNLDMNQSEKSAPSKNYKYNKPN